MLSERDKAVVAQMCRTGMALDVLIESFPQFDKSDVEAVFNEEKESESDDFGELRISINCS